MEIFLDLAISNEDLFYFLYIENNISIYKYGNNKPELNGGMGPGS